MGEREVFHRGEPEPDTRRHRGGGGKHTHRSQWEHLARRKARQNWSARKIAKFLGRSLDEVREVIAS